jgi:1-acyl-sn-glycerol-3-phosphate acyltransferase
MIAAIVLFGFYIVAAPIASLLGFPWVWITGDIGPLYRMGVWIAGTGIRLARIHIEVSGREKLPPGSCIFMCNHVSNLDPCVVIPLISRRVSILIKKQLMGLPLLGPAMKRAKFIAIDRTQLDSAIRSLHEAQEVLNSGLSLFIFAQGTLSLDGRLQPLKKGPFYLAFEAGAPFVPISLHGTESMMRKGSMRVFPSTAHVTFHDAIDPKTFPDREALMDAVRSSIASALPEWMTSPITSE